MNPIAADLLARAERDLRNSSAIAFIPIPEVAAREAYMATFHVAQALVVERTGRSPKTHSGVRHAFGQIVIRERLDEQLGRFLSRAYDYKTIADYDMTKRISPEEAMSIVEKARQFVAAVQHILEKPAQSGQP